MFGSKLLKSSSNILTNLELWQFCQVSLAALTNWQLKLNSYIILENKYNKFVFFSEENIESGRFWNESCGRLEIIPKNGRFRLKWKGWSLCACSRAMWLTKWWWKWFCRSKNKSSTFLYIEYNKDGNKMLKIIWMHKNVYLSLYVYMYNSNGKLKKFKLIHTQCQIVF